jgi:hypothetical protein
VQGEADFVAGFAYAGEDDLVGGEASLEGEVKFAVAGDICA